MHMAGKLFCVCLHFVNRRKESILKEKEGVRAGDAQQTGALFAVNKPGETKAATPALLINGGSRHGQGCSCSSPGCCVGEEQSPGLSAVGAPHMGGLQHHGLGLLPAQGRQEQGGPHSLEAPESTGWMGASPCPGLPAAQPVLASLEWHKCQPCHAAMSSPVPSNKEYFAAFTGRIGGTRGLSIPAGLATP